MKSMYLRAHWAAPSRSRLWRWVGKAGEVASHLEKAEVVVDMAAEEENLDHRFDWFSRMLETV